MGLPLCSLVHNMLNFKVLTVTPTEGEYHLMTSLDCDPDVGRGHKHLIPYKYIKKYIYIYIYIHMHR